MSKRFFKVNRQVGSMRPRLAVFLAISAAACSQAQSDRNKRQVSVAPVKADHFRLEWCQAEEILRWTFRFGEKPDQTISHSPPKWSGDFSYQVQSANGTSFAGGGSSHPQGLSTTPYFWVHNHEVKAKVPPQKLRFKFRLAEQEFLSTEFEIGKAADATGGDCVSLPINKLTQW